MTHRPSSLLVPALTVLVTFAAGVLPSGACAEEPAATESAAPMEFDTYQLVLLIRPAERPEIPEEEAARIQSAHLGHLRRMAEEGHMVAAGPFGEQDDERKRGLALYRVGSVEEARRLAEQDPAVRAGRLEVEVMTWYTEKGAVAFPGVEELGGEG